MCVCVYAVIPLCCFYMFVLLFKVGGDTCFADMTAAYDDLSSEKQRYYEGLTAEHNWQQTFPWWQQAPEAIRNQLMQQFQPVEHPVVRTHPVTGRKAILVINKTIYMYIYIYIYNKCYIYSERERDTRPD